jgi:UDPglucose 6-dehydrogenase
MSHKIAIIGTGYVGIVSGTTFAAHGNEVICVDIDIEKIEKLKQGISPIFEPGLEWLLKKNYEEGRLNFTTDLATSIESSDLVFLCLPTPPSEDGSADLQHVLNVAKDIAVIIRDYNLPKNKIIIDKSTVPVGTGDKVEEIFDLILGENDIEVVSNPEFLREGFAVEDAMKPERVVVGTSSERVKYIMRDLYDSFLRSGNPLIFMDRKSAELTKYAANAFLATKISFMNDLSRFCEVVGADIELIRKGIGADSRIGKRFIFPGIGYGGSCFPKDVRALMYSSEEIGLPLQIIQATQQVNNSQIEYFYKKIKDRFKNLKGKKIAIWGLSFKPNTDDVRESPAFKLIDIFLENGVEIQAYDPEAIENTRKQYGDKIKYYKDPYSVLSDVDALVLVTEWSLFRSIDFNKMKALMKNYIIFDGRNQYEIEEMINSGFEYHSVGRKSIFPNVSVD